METKTNSTRDLIPYILAPQNFHAMNNTVTIPFPNELVAGDIVDISFTATLKCQTPQEIGYSCRITYSQGIKTFTFPAALINGSLSVRVQFDNKKAIFVNLLSGDDGYFQSLSDLTIVYHKNYTYIRDIIEI